MTQPNAPALAALDRIVLVYALAVRPRTWVDPLWIARLTGAKVGGGALVVGSVARLEAQGLVVSRQRGSRVWSKRTSSGVEEADRLLRSGRISFWRALEEVHRATSDS
jgi:hypothetical protein